MTFGIVPEGFRLKVLRDILTDIETDQHAEISTTLDVSPAAPDGQRNAILARQNAAEWEALALVYDALNPDNAEDTQLVNLCKLTGTVPRSATPSVVTCTCTIGAGGATLTPGVQFASIVGKPDVLWTPLTLFATAVAGSYPVKFVSVEAGPVPANASTITVIAVGTSGWTDVTNPLDAVRGRSADTNESLRALREQELASAGSSTVDAIRADILRLTDEDGSFVIETCTVYENDTDAIDANGLPPHSVECVIVDSPTQLDTFLAQAVWEAKGGGIKGTGNTTSLATDAQGKTHVVSFTRPIEIDIWLIYDLETDADYAGDAAFAIACADFLRVQHPSGASVLRAVCEREAWKFPGIVNILSVKLGTAPAPTLSTDITLSVRQRAGFDSTRISRT